ncbi:MAG: hypothetical protein IJ157_06045, partial [Clostridia bacterium]|nr:hypothetical protein [Clostridia bacterium]
RGPETIRTAVMKSDNTAAAYALMNYVGLDNSYNFLRLLGVSEKHINKTPFGLALGSSGISPVEMAVGYGTLANSGVYQEPITFLGIADSTGRVIYDSHANQRRYQAFSPSTAWLMVDILKDTVKNGTASKANIKGQTVAGKTGTNSDQKGVFFAGMTGWYAGTVWIGHDNYKALSSKTTGGNSAATLWNVFMNRIHMQKNLANRDIIEGTAEEYGLVRVTTCAVSGQLATEACRKDANGYGVVTDYWPAGSAPTHECQMHTLVNLCAESGMLAGEYCPHVTQAGIITIPAGHPLYNFIGAEYDSVLSRYLGRYATLRMSSSVYQNQAILSTLSCTLHSYGAGYDGSVYSADPLVRDQLLPDAQSILAAARARLSALPEGHPAYAALFSAISNLEAVAGGAPTAADLTAAMALLTQAMAQAQ